MVTRSERAGLRSGKGLLLALAAIVLLSLNLRIPTTALGPLLPAIQADTAHGETFLSLLTTIPLALTLIVAPFAPRIAVRFGRDRVIGFALIAIVAGTLIRSIPGDAGLLAGTVVLGAAIALGTVLAPASIAAAHPSRRAPLTGAYTMALSLGPALALALTVPMMRVTGLGWRETLMLWSVCGLLGLVVWVLHARALRLDAAPTPQGKPPAALEEAADAATNGPSAAARPVIKDPRVWELAVYLGVTSLTFYTVATWLPTSFVEAGLSSGAAGGYVSLVNVVAIPCALLAPIMMRRGQSRILAPAAPLVAGAGIVLLLVAGTNSALVTSLLLGISQGLCLGVAYGQIVEYATSPEHAASVSAVTSAVGIALAAVGPLAFGFGLEASGSYVVSMVGLGVVVLIQAALGVRTGRA